MLKTALYIGLNDKNTKKQEITTDVAKQVIIYAVVKQHLDFTLFECNGVYTHENGVVVIEKSFKIELLCFENEKVFNEKILQVVKDLKVMLNQESVAVTREYIESELL